ncbi:MAG: DUF1501 domain-containing protein [Planctomycetota bacterium]|nr:DUF1501 domain-containing protein [Planctomycetota bacterium]
MIRHDAQATHRQEHRSQTSRRRFLAASGAGLMGLPGSFAVQPALSAENGPLNSEGTAKSTILIVLAGGASHIDTWDMKPDAPAEIRGEFQPIETSSPGVRLCEHLPLTAQHAHRLAVVNSVDGTDPTNSHLGYYYHLTGHKLDPRTINVPAERRQQRDDWPFIGSVVSAKLPQRGVLPNAISYPWTPDGPADLRAGQFAGRLGIEHDPLCLTGKVEEPLKFQAPALVLKDGLSAKTLLHRRALLNELDQTRREFEQHRETQVWQRHQDRAFSLLSSAATTRAFDLTREPEELRERYGKTLNGMGLLLARRLVEAKVPFVTLFWMPDRARAKKLKCASAGGWDTHGNNFECLKKMLLPEFDQCFSALLEDLTDRGLLDSTLLLVTSEMGRKPKIGDPRSGGVSGAGRDHWTYCLTDLLAGGGIQGGQTYGTSDKHAGYPADQRVTPSDIAKTVYHAMGIHDLSATDNQNRPYNLQEHGRPLLELL